MEKHRPKKLFDQNGARRELGRRGSTQPSGLASKGWALLRAVCPVDSTR